MAEQWLTVYQVAEILKKHPQTIRNWIRNKYCEAENRKIKGKYYTYVLYTSIPTFLRRTEDKNKLKVVKKGDTIFNLLP